MIHFINFPCFQNLEVKFVICPSSALDMIHHINFLISSKSTFYLYYFLNQFFFFLNPMTGLMHVAQLDLQHGLSSDVLPMHVIPS